ncbi:hypothetical protein GCM10010390_62140 [Streptomyces mordarskii]|uniref:Uncharacterized protein n=1 Tax=Streptomyces mordarskii TaxID=1226758 RepID=A0ABP3NR08_9ACTN
MTAVDDGNGGGHQVSAAVAVRVSGVVEGAAEEFLGDDEFDALLQKQGRGRVPEVVEADAAEAGLAEECGEGAGEVGRVDRSALRGGEDVPVGLPRGACCLALALLLFGVEFQRVDAAGG